VYITREIVLANLHNAPSGDELDDRVAFWDQVGNAIVHEIEEAAFYGEDGVDMENEHEGEEEHEHSGGCCGGDEHEHADGEEEHAEGEDHEGEDHEGEDEGLEDDFQITRSGPNFALRAFLALIYIPTTSFETIALDLNAVIPFLMQLSKDAWSPSETEKRSVSQIVCKRLTQYKTSLKQDAKMQPVDLYAQQALQLRMEEKEILHHFL
jgi:Rubisco LSMT substrate-binding